MPELAQAAFVTFVRSPVAHALITGIDAATARVGTYGSRSLQLGGAAVYQAAGEVREKARPLAAGMIEASEADLELDAARGTWQVRGDPATGVSWAQIASQAGPGGLAADVKFTASQPTFPFGAHLAVVEVDVETGKVRLVRHVTDAVAHLGVRHIDTPATPERVWSAIGEASGAREARASR